jgi:hypothetical protein
MRGVGEDKEAVTGTKSWAYFVADINELNAQTNDYPIVMFVEGKYPMRGAIAEVQTIEPYQGSQYSAEQELKQMLSRKRTIRITEADAVPGAHPLSEHLTIGKYAFMIFSVGGICTESLEISRNSSGQITQTYKVYNGRKLVAQFPAKKNKARPQ